MAGLGLMSGKETLWIDHGWRGGGGAAVPKEATLNATLNAEYAEVDASCALSSFYRKAGGANAAAAAAAGCDAGDPAEPTPYATTMLLSQLPGQPPSHIEVKLRRTSASIAVAKLIDSTCCVFVRRRTGRCILWVRTPTGPQA